jgi:hypothetical protein
MTGKKIITLFTLSILCGCSLNEDKIENLQYKVDSLEAVIDDQTEIILKLKSTDTFKYREATEYFNSEEYFIAKDLYQKFINNFPNSELIPEVRAKLKIIKSTEEKTYKSLLKNIKSKTLIEKIQSLESYITERHDEEYLKFAKSKLSKYQSQYEKNKDQLLVEQAIGVKLISSESEWAWSGSYGNRLLVPKLKLKFKNISEQTVTKLVVKATFINIDKKEVFSDGAAYVIGYSDTPLRPGYSKTAFIESGVGYASDLVALSFPNIDAEIYINDRFYKKVRVSKMYEGIDYGKK